MTVFPAGHILTSADFDLLFPTGIGAWQAFVPTLTQSNSPTFSSACAYQKVGRLVVVRYSLALTAAGTAANAITFTLPVASASAEVGINVGSFWMNDSGTAFYSGSLRTASTTQVQMFNGGSSTAAMGATGGGFVAALASGDQITGRAIYEAAA